MTVLAPPRFSLRLPESWFEFDVWRANRTGDLSRMVDERLRDLPELRPHRSLILRALRQLAADAERSGAVYSAAAADTGGDGSLIAFLMVFSTAGMPEPGLNTVEAIAAQIPALRPSPDDGSWREVRIVELNAGRAVRVRGLSPLDGADPRTRVQVVSMQTFVPIPGRDSVLNIVLSSPQVAIADALLDLFALISDSLAWEEGPPPR